MSICFFLTFKILIIRNILRVLLFLSASSSFSGCKNDLDVIVCIIKQLEFAVRSSEPLSGGDVCEFFKADGCRAQTNSYNKDIAMSIF